MRMLYALGVCLVASAPAVAETAYRWLDEEGKPAFSDRPPATIPAEPITIAPLAPAASALRSGEKHLLSEIEQRERSNAERKEKAQAEQRSTAEERRRQCRDIDRALDGRPSREERADLLSQRRELRCGVR